MKIIVTWGSVTIDGFWIDDGIYWLFVTARDYILQLTYSLVAVETCLFAEPLPSSGCFIVAYFAVVA
jgi:hypothetical protein